MKHLFISGGGIKGIYEIGILLEIEKHFCKD